MGSPLSGFTRLCFFFGRQSHLSISITSLSCVLTEYHPWCFRMATPSICRQIFFVIFSARRHAVFRLTRILQRVSEKLKEFQSMSWPEKKCWTIFSEEASCSLSVLGFPLSLLRGNLLPLILTRGTHLDDEDNVNRAPLSSGPPARQFASSFFDERHASAQLQIEVPSL